jgi:hypothetical protein
MITPAIQVPRFLISALLCASLDERAVSLDPRKVISRYAYHVWQTGQGLPQGR